MNKPLSLVESQAEKSSGQDIRYLVKALVKHNASDLHIKAGRPPLYRINGKLVAAKVPSLTAEDVIMLIKGFLTDTQLRILQERRQVDMSFQVESFGRFRASVFFQKDTIAAVIRMIPITVPSFDELGLPVILKELINKPRGLLLVTGPTGSGKSTTLATLIQLINETRPVHILTIEDPIEFMFLDKKASITQRELGSDTRSFQEALYSGLRQDPDVIVIGEMREPQVIQTALTAAETGHLVISTLHTNNAKSTIDRILEVCPSENRNQVRIELASTLVGVFAQQLLLRADGNGRVCACEVMVKSPAIEQHILKNELDKIPEAMANSSSYYQMQTLNQDLERLISSGLVTIDEALKISDNPADLRLRLNGIKREEGYDGGGGTKSYRIERF